MRHCIENQGLNRRGRLHATRVSRLKSADENADGDCGNRYRVRGTRSPLPPAYDFYTLPSMATLCIAPSRVAISIVRVEELDDRYIQKRETGPGGYNITPKLGHGSDWCWLVSGVVGRDIAL